MISIKIDFLNIDAGGHVFEIFQAFDFERFSPLMICIETSEFNPQERELFENKMEEFNYQKIGKFEIFSDFYLLK